MVELATTLNDVEYDYSNIISQMREDKYLEMYNGISLKVADANNKLKAALKGFIPDACWLRDYDKIASWLQDNKGKGLMLLGSVGIGKTIMCEYVIPTIIYSEIGKIFQSVSAVDLLNVYDNIRKYKLIVIDDLGREDVSPKDFGTTKTPFASLVDAAEREKKLLLITSNLTPAELSERYDKRTIDRLHKIVNTVILRGDSFRK